MSAVIEVQEPSAKYLSALQPKLVQHFELLGTAPGGVAKLRELILTLGVQGKLVPQDPNEEPASELLKKIREEKDRLISEGRIKRDKPLAEMGEENAPFPLQQGWEFVRLGEIGLVGSSSRVHQSDWKGSGIPFYRAREIVKLSRDGYVSNELFISEELFASLTMNGWVPEEEDIMITGVGTIGIPYVVRPSDRFYFKDASVLIFKNYGRLNAQWLSWFMRSPLWIEGIHEHSMGTTVDTLTIARANIALVPLPPAEEQSRIVARVEELMRLCDTLEAKSQLEAAQHAQLVQTLLGALTASSSPVGLAENWQRVATHFDLLLDRTEAIDALEQTILQLAIRGLLVPKDPKDEPASELLKKIRAEKDRLIAEGKIKRDKPLPPIEVGEHPFDLPTGWEWARLNDLIRIGSGDGLTAAQMDPNGQIPVYGGNGVTGHHNRSNVEEPTLVIGRVGYYCGSVHVTPSRAWVTDNAFITRYPRALLDMNWLYWLLVGTNLKENDAATAQPVISGRKLYPIVVAVPPIAEQVRIVARLESLRHLCADLRQRLATRQITQAHLAEALIDEVA